MAGEANYRPQRDTGGKRKRTGPWIRLVRFLRVVAEDPRLTGANRRTLELLISYTNPHGTCYPSHSTLGDRLGTSRQAAQQQINRLVELGYVEKFRHSTTKGRASNRYRILLNRPELSTDRPPPGKPQSLPPPQAPNLAPPARPRACREDTKEENQRRRIAADTDQRVSGDDWTDLGKCLAKGIPYRFKD